jgi:NADH:ubiquinone oxidoreductase subunit K
MDTDIAVLFITFCGLVGIFLRRNLLNIIVSFLQIIIGLSIMLITTNNFFNNSIQELSFYLILVFAFIIILFIYAVVLLLIRRRSTVHVNELTELRG